MTKERHASQTSRLSVTSDRSDVYEPVKGDVSFLCLTLDARFCGKGLFNFATLQEEEHWLCAIGNNGPASQSRSRAHFWEAEPGAVHDDE